MRKYRHEHYFIRAIKTKDGNMDRISRGIRRHIRKGGN